MGLITLVLLRKAFPEAVLLRRAYVYVRGCLLDNVKETTYSCYIAELFKMIINNHLTVLAIKRKVIQLKSYRGLF